MKAKERYYENFNIEKAIHERNYGVSKLKAEAQHEETKSALILTTEITALRSHANIQIIDSL